LSSGRLSKVERYHSIVRFLTASECASSCLSGSSGGTASDISRQVPAEALVLAPASPWAGLGALAAGQLMQKDRGVANAPVAVVRRNERKQLAFPGSDIHYELLTPDMRRRASLLWVEAPPGSESGPLFSHEGEDGVVVLKGAIEVEVGGLWHRLETGDSIYFNAGIPHRWRNCASEPAEAVWLSTPPSF